MAERPTASERFFFDTNGYLLLEGVLDPGHVVRLRAALEAAVERRRELARTGREVFRATQNLENGTRIFYLLAEDELFLDLIDLPAVMPYVTGLLNEAPHFHASDAFRERGPSAHPPGWHIDGADAGYRRLGPYIPLLQLKIAYFLSDMSAPDQGNLTVVPGSHRAQAPPDERDLQGFESVPGAVQIRCPPGSCAMFHNALWHTRGPARRADGERVILYYAYEHPWMAASPEPTSYPPSFYAALPPARRRFFQPVVLPSDGGSAEPSGDGGSQR